MTDTLDRPETVRELISDLDQLMGVQGRWSTEPERILQSAEKVKELARDLLTELFGLEVRGL